MQCDFQVAGIESWLTVAAEASGVVHEMVEPQSQSLLGNSSSDFS